MDGRIESLKEEVGSCKSEMRSLQRLMAESKRRRLSKEASKLESQTPSSAVSYSKGVHIKYLIWGFAPEDQIRSANFFKLQEKNQASEKKEDGADETPSQSAEPLRDSNGASSTMGSDTLCDGPTQAA